MHSEKPLHTYPDGHDPRASLVGRQNGAAAVETDQCFLPKLVTESPYDAASPLVGDPREDGKWGPSQRPVP